MTQHWSELLTAMVQASERVAAVEMGSGQATDASMVWDASRSRVAGQHERALFTDEQGNVLPSDPTKAAVYR